MTGLKRPNNTPHRWPGPWGYLGIAIGISGVVGFAAASSISQMFVSLVTSAVAVGFVAKKDQKAYVAKQAERLREIGLELLPHDDTREHANATLMLERMVPNRLVENIQRWGPLEGASRTTIVGATGSGEDNDAWIFIVVKTTLLTEPFAIGPRKMTTPKGLRRLSVNHDTFQRYRSVWTTSNNAATSADRIIQANGDAFFVPDKGFLSFSMLDPPGKHEQWAYADGWLAYADIGQPRADPLIDAIMLTTQVAERLERSAARTS